MQAKIKKNIVYSRIAKKANSFQTEALRTANPTTRRTHTMPIAGNNSAT